MVVTSRRFKGVTFCWKNFSKKGQNVSLMFQQVEKLYLKNKGEEICLN